MQFNQESMATKSFLPSCKLLHVFQNVLLSKITSSRPYEANPIGSRLILEQLLSAGKIHLLQ